MLRQLGAPELMIILGVVVLLFGAKKLPELARGSGRALRIFKAETQGLMDEETEPAPTEFAAVDSSMLPGTDVVEVERQNEPTV